MRAERDEPDASRIEKHGRGEHQRSVNASQLVFYNIELCLFIIVVLLLYVKLYVFIIFVYYSCFNFVFNIV